MGGGGKGLQGELELERDTLLQLGYTMLSTENTHFKFPL